MNRKSMMTRDDRAEPTTLAAPARNRQNIDVQWLRAAAAFFVVVFHASTYTRTMFGDTRFSDVFDGKFGLVGVAIFFAISGALMADLLRRTEPSLFLAHRLVRIYPLFILTTIVVAVLRHGELHLDIRALSLALVGRRVQFELVVEWTLVVEVFFYVLLFLLAVLRGARWLEGFAVGWLVLIGIAAVLDTDQMGATLAPTVAQILFLPGNAAFAGGLLIPAILKRGSVPPALFAVAFGCGAVSMSMDLAYGRLVGSIAAVIIVGSAFGHRPSDGTAPSRVGRAFGRLGDWSYALYLCHVPVILLVYNYVPASPAVLWVLAIGCAVLVSIPVGLFDIALYRRLRSATNQSSPVKRTRLIQGYVLAYALVAVVFLFKQG